MTLHKGRFQPKRVVVELEAQGNKWRELDDDDILSIAYNGTTIEKRVGDLSANGNMPGGLLGGLWPILLSA